MHDHPTTGSGSPGRVTDPVCGMKVPEDAPLGLDQSDRTYRFCSRHCLKRFQAEPERYLAQAAAADDAAADGSDTATGQCCDHGDYGQGAPHLTGGADGAHYVCPMCPEIREPAPGACPSCGMALEPETPTAPATRTEYTCPMHPEVVLDGPGSCPKCGMALEPRTVTAEDAPDPELADRRPLCPVMADSCQYALASESLLPG